MALTRPRFDQLKSEKADFSDELVLVNSASTLANTDIGFVFNRDGGVSANVAVFWSESAKAFTFANTVTSTDTISNIVVSSYSSVKMDNAMVNTGLVFADGTSVSSAGTLGFRNRLLNGDGRIDVRNRGSRITPITGQYLADRFVYSSTQTGNIAFQQNMSSVNPPAGFSSYLGFQTAATCTPISSDAFTFSQRIHGYSLSDLGWGTAAASPASVSFQVYTNVLGTHTGVIRNATGTRSYPFSYTVTNANVWTPIALTITGDTSGTWNTTTGIGAEVVWTLGAGTGKRAAAGSWTSSNVSGATGGTNVTQTLNAVFFTTGMQFERGPSSSYDFRPPLIEESLCSYYALPIQADGGSDVPICTGVFFTTSELHGSFLLPLRMRAAPTLGTVSGSIVVLNGTTTQAATLSLTGTSTTSVEMKLVTGVAAFSINSTGMCRLQSGGYIVLQCEL
jgi:hypothetical protein